MPAPRHALLPLLLLVLSSAVALANQRVLLYTAVANDGFYHPSIPAAVRAMKQLGEDNQVDMVHCNDRDEFEDLDLSQFDALAFVNAAGSILTKKGAGHMRNYIENGGGYVGVHEASCAATSTPWYLRLVGAQFSYHPEMSSATMDILDHDHPSTAHLPGRWDVVDEFYNFFSNPRDLGATVGVAADESTYWDEIQPLKERAKLQGSPHPISWWREGELLSAPKSKLGGGLDNLRKDIRKGIQGSGGAGRSWYTGLGHTSACWKKDDFLQHVWGGLTWVLDSTTIASNQLQPGPDTPGQKYNGTSDPHVGRNATRTGSATGASTSPGPSVSGGAQRHANGSTSGAAPKWGGPASSPLAGMTASLLGAMAMVMMVQLCLS